jgi:hypothetical protein
MKFIDNAREALTHYSTIALSVATSLQGAWLSIPESMKADLPSFVAETVAIATFATTLFGLIGKFIKQGNK